MGPPDSKSVPPCAVASRPLQLIFLGWINRAKTWQLRRITRIPRQANRILDTLSSHQCAVLSYLDAATHGTFLFFQRTIPVVTDIQHVYALQLNFFFRTSIRSSSSCGIKNLKAMF